MKSVSTDKTQQAIILLTYLICASIFGLAYRYAITPDGISLLRSAGYIAEGHFQRSVNVGWSPLITWLISPLLFLGVDELLSARIVIALCGSGFLVCSWFFAARFDLSKNSRFAAVMISALLISYWTILSLNPDVLFGAIILFYFYLITGPDILTSKHAPFFCGIAGGIAYLTHHYAFPFFLAHFPLIILLRGFLDRDGPGFSFKKVSKPLGAGIAGFLIVTSIWISVVSVKYGKLSITAKGGVAHAIMGPKDVDRRHPFFVGGLFKPRDDYAIHVFEDPSDVKFKMWSPFESKEYFIHQLKLIRINIDYVINHFVNNSPFFTYAAVIGILVLIPLAYLLNPLDEKKRFLYIWVVCTFSVYSSGFVLTLAKSPRRFYVLMIVFIFLSFHFMEGLKNAINNGLNERREKILACFLLLMAVSAFSIKPGLMLLKSLKNVIASEQMNPYSEMAEQIRTIEFPAPYAIIRTTQKPHTDTYIAFYLKKQFLGRPLSQDVDGITEELKSADARSLLVFDNLEVVEELKNDERYVYLASRKFKDTIRYAVTIDINIHYHELVTGWDDEVNIFALK